LNVAYFSICYRYEEDGEMAKNVVQFQPGLSLPAFQERFGSEDQFRAALVAMRWPSGFVCPHCGCPSHSY